MGSLFLVINYGAAAYLIWLGIGIWRLKSQSTNILGIKEVSWLSNFLCGLLITLGDPKAILFYLSFFPAFLDLETISLRSITILIVITILAVGGAKVWYAYLADRSRLLFQRSKARNALSIVASSIMMGTGLYLVIRQVCLVEAQAPVTGRRYT